MLSIYNGIMNFWTACVESVSGMNEREESKIMHDKERKYFKELTWA